MVLCAFADKYDFHRQRWNRNRWIDDFIHLRVSIFKTNNFTLSKLTWVYPPVTLLLTTCLMEQQSKTQLKMERIQRDESVIQFISHAHLIVSQPFKCSENSCHFQEDKKCKSIKSRIKIQNHTTHENFGRLFLVTSFWKLFDSIKDFCHGCYQPHSHAIIHFPIQIPRWHSLTQTSLV